MTAVIARPQTPVLVGQWTLDPVRPTDGRALADLFARCSPDTIRLRFFGMLHAFPRRYLEDVLAGRPDVHDAVVARHPNGGHLAGMASLSAGSAAGAELGVLVADDWQRQGLGAAMVELLVSRARERGVERLAAGVLPERPELLAALSRRLQLQSLSRSRECTTGVFELML